MYQITPPLASIKLACFLIKDFEGCHLKAYPDPLSKAEPYTIGFGTTVYEDGVRVADWHEISQRYAEQLLTLQVMQGMIRLQSKIPGWHKLSPQRQSVLLSFGYNLGYGFYGSDGFYSISRDLGNMNYDAIPETLLKYVNPGSNVEEGLTNRRRREGAIWEKNP